MKDADNKKESRTRYAVRNSAAGILSKIIILLLSFFSRTVFIYILGEEYLGINSLYSEILSLLSVAELGFGTALNFALYKPISENDEEKIKRILQYYKKVYTIIAFVIAGIGIILIPFLKYIVKGAEQVFGLELVIYYLIFLTNTVTGYFVTYKYNYVNALQKNFITTTIDTIIELVIRGLQIVVLLITHDFLLYLLTNTAILIVSRIFIGKYLDNRFILLKEKPGRKLSKEEKEPILKDVRGAFVYNISSVAVHSTDSIIISSLSGLGVAAVGYVSNYNMIITSVLTFITILFSNTAAGFGNLVASSDKEQFRKVFHESEFFAFWLHSFCAIEFYILIPQLISLWIGKKYLIDDVSFFLIVLNSYLQGYSIAFTYARGAVGEFIRDRRVGVYQAVVNLIVSIVGVKLWGLPGVYVGTVISRFVFVLSRPYIIYEFCFGKSYIEYFKRFFFFLSVTIALGTLVNAVFGGSLLSQTWLGLLVKAIMTAIIVNGIYLILFHKNREFIELKGRVALWLKKN